MAAAAALLAAASPIDDPNDTYWHVRVGDDIRTERQIAGAGDSWAWFDPPDPWISSQWLAEVGMSWGVETWGWGSITAATLVVSIASLGTLWVAVRGVATPRVAAVVFALVSLPLGFSFQTRPGVITLVGAAVMGGISLRVLHSGQLPTWWGLPLVTLWANVHGGWVVAPAALGVAVALRWLEAPRERLPFLGQGVARTVAMLAAGSIHPLGLRSVLLPFEFQGATERINEWQATVVFEWVSLPLVAVLVVFAVAWARGANHVPYVELLYVFVWSAFGFVAFRNVAVAALLLAPLAAWRASQTFPGSRRVESARERRVLLVALSTLTVTGALIVSGSLLTTDPLEDAVPLAIAERLAASDGPVRVLNHYNTAGVLLAFGPPGIELGIDGRTERFGGEYIDDYLAAFALEGDDWMAFVDRLDPEFAVVATNDALRHYLEDDLGWRRVLVDDPFVLLTP